MALRIGLGLDTGGTYTDAVLLDMDTNEILAKNKAFTTKKNLAEGLGEAISSFNGNLLSSVCLVSLSSTLATNSVVEGKGCRVALICSGRGYDGQVPVEMKTTVAGSHDVSGNEDQPLDEAAVGDFIDSLDGKVDCVAVTGYMAVRNPEHEIAVRRMVEERLDVPVVCGHELSSSLGFRERATTTILNARLIPVIKDLIISVRKIMALYSIRAPLMVVKGDGSVVDEAVAERRPVETILSGPAASISGASIMTGLSDAVVVDIGGTTTDIGILRDGHPAVDNDGAVIGGFKTHVRAAEIFTSGIGGDSRIVVNGGEALLMPKRVMPLCTAVEQWPEIRGMLADALETDPHRTYETMDLDNLILESEFFVSLRRIVNDPVSETDRRFLQALSGGPLTLREAGRRIDVHPLHINLHKLEERNLVQRIGFTPTDILHAEGTLSIYDAEASRLGLSYLARKAGLGDSDMASMLREKVVCKIAREILGKLMYDETGSSVACPALNDLKEKVVRRSKGRDFSCNVTLNKPIIGIGAPVDAWLPEVAARFSTEYVSPQDHDVGNAVGAISGCIQESITAVVEPSARPGGKCTVFSSLGRMEFDSVSEAVSSTLDMCAAHAKAMAEESGAESVTISYDRKDRTYTDLNGGDVLMDVTLKIVATGRPKLS
jgi:N-methylhydantoinase A/oxoprolinase/acetone carboxylase beta subunit